MKTLFTSDLHFGHKNILEYTPQRRDYLGLSASADVMDMNEAIVELWNRQVEPDDEVVIIGDVAMGLVQDTIRYVSRLKGTKYLVRGNHDRTHPSMWKSEAKTIEWERLYAEVGLIPTELQFTHNFDGIEALVCHFPYPGNDHSEDRYNADKLSLYYPEDNGRPLVHGHVHDLYQTRGHMMNVGIDAWNGRFLQAKEIGDYFRSKGF